MGLVKKGSTAVEAPAAPEVAKPESGTAAAIARLQAQGTQPAQQAATAPKYAKPRDFDKEARGKTRCVQFEAALMSPAIAGMAFKTMKEYLALVREAADEGVKYSFENDLSRE
jgi:hypothetical protein